jgi:glycoprotein endo-alpha-1,2-mannosidase
MTLPGDQLRAVLDQFPGDLFLAETGNVRNVESGYFAEWAAASHFQAVYTYEAVRYEGADLVAFCAYARRVGLGCVPAVAPGFSSIRAEGSVSYARSRGDGATYDKRWMGAIGAHADEVAITSFNEWNEGTQIEAAVPKCLSAAFCYQNYDGAYGLSGVPAAAAYLGRTRVWADRYRAASP